MRYSIIWKALICNDDGTFNLNILYIRQYVCFIDRIHCISLQDYFMESSMTYIANEYKICNLRIYDHGEILFCSSGGMILINYRKKFHQQHDYEMKWWTMLSFPFTPYKITMCECIYCMNVFWLSMLKGIFHLAHFIYWSDINFPYAQESELHQVLRMNSIEHTYRHCLTIEFVYMHCRS